jgi:Secretion system C-terminal sorting domain
MKHLYCSFLFLVLLNATTTSAQATLIASTRTVRSGDSVTVNLNISTRDTLSTMQFTLQWNTATLAFGRIDTLGGFPPTSDGDEFGTANIPTGRLSFVWTSKPNVSHRPLPDSLIFKVVFKAIGAQGTNSPIQFVGTPTAMRASNPRLQNIPVTGRNGLVLIGNVATKDLSTEGGDWVQNSPNPFDNQTVVRFKLAESSPVTLQIVDAQGRLMHTQKGFYAAGEHNIDLHTEGVLPKGMYLLSLQTNKNLLTRNVIKQ